MEKNTKKILLIVSIVLVLLGAFVFTKNYTVMGILMGVGMLMFNIIMAGEKGNKQ